MKIAVSTLGCKVNQYESQAMEKLFEEKGCELAPFSSDADAYIINTCSVTAESDRKSRQLIRRVRSAHPAAIVAVCGCFSQTHPEQAQKLEADVLYGTNDKLKFVEDVVAAVREKGKTERIDNAFSRRIFEQLPAGGLSGRTRAMLKVQDGCVNFCTYCIIPYARGALRSLPQAEAVSEAERLFNEGLREIVITGIEISSYGRDLKDGSDLISLTAAICAAVPEMRVRLGSLEPREITERFCETLSGYKNLCPHFHLSLQSGSDGVLERMGRKYDTARFFESVELLRKYFPDRALTADLIAGFPAETEAELNETLAFIKKCAFSAMHVFPYSKRPGTKAAEMDGQLTSAEKERRAAGIRAAAEEMRQAYLRGCVGKTYPVLFEQGGTGHAPNYTEVRVSGADELRGQVLNVRITGVEQDSLTGQL